MTQLQQEENFMDEAVDCSNFFDHIDDLLDFPSDDIIDSLPPPTLNDNANNENDTSFFDEASFPDITDSVVFFDNKNENTSSGLSAELSVPYEDIVQLEWLSNFVEDSFSAGSLTMNKDDINSLSTNKDSSSSSTQFHTSSPVSVLDSSSSSCSGDKLVPRSPEFVNASGRCGRARSKRSRPATFTPRSPMQMQLIPSPTSSVAEAQLTVISPKDYDNFAESRLVIKMPKPVGSEIHKKKKTIKFTVPAPPADALDSNSPPIRKCLHCEVTKTPQWRAGPMGPKTLCNACGVRYKSGRLFPEYRPAASPTFIPSLHSNSHKKVIEMRNKEGEDYLANVTTTNLPDLIPNNNNIAMEYM